MARKKTVKVVEGEQNAIEHGIFTGPVAQPVARPAGLVSENEVAMFCEVSIAALENEMVGRHTSKGLELIVAGYRRGVEETLRFLQDEGRIVVTHVPRLYPVDDPERAP
jgi:hypothetical protein